MNAWIKLEQITESGRKDKNPFWVVARVKIKVLHIWKETSKAGYWVWGCLRGGSYLEIISNGIGGENNILLLSHYTTECLAHGVSTGLVFAKRLNKILKESGLRYHFVLHVATRYSRN